jgi:hypothetical protein
MLVETHHLGTSAPRHLVSIGFQVLGERKLNCASSRDLWS